MRAGTVENRENGERGGTGGRNTPRPRTIAGYARTMTHLGIDLAPIPAGTVTLRDARSGSIREVLLRSFEMATTALTNAAFHQSDATDQPRTPAHGITWFDAIEWCNHASADAGYTPAYTLRGESVDWDVSADGFRLPTEAEWEFACRAGTTTPTYAPLDDIAWTSADAVAGPQPVGLKLPNAFGLFDMIGNVWEWCWDYADTARYGAYRSIRGGGWADPVWSSRASVRRASAPDAVIEDIGFRVARGAVGASGRRAAQGWSAEADAQRASLGGPRPVGWTPLRP